jgi:DNA processing protein
LEGRGVHILALGEPGYPEALADLSDPPPALFLMGDPRCLERTCVAVVGSRLSTAYGQNVAQMLGEDLAKAGCTVVSGLARGIDAFAHRGSLVTPGSAVAVMATGIDHIYPSEHEPLAHSIVGAGGAILTEAPPGTPPVPRLFPVRNRIIAGLSWAVVVVEATERSGSLITARLALESGRELFAVPHNITSRTGVGPNTLLQKGARLVQQASDILDEMPAYLKERLAPEGEPGVATPGAPAVSQDAGTLLATLRPDEPLGVDALALATGMGASRLLTLLLELQVAGLCSQAPGGRYVRSKMGLFG